MAAGPEITSESTVDVKVDAGQVSLLPKTEVFESDNINVDSTTTTTNNNNNNNNNNNHNSNDDIVNSDDRKSSSDMKMQKEIVDMFPNLKLNPMAKEFFPSSYQKGGDQNEIGLNYFAPAFYVNSHGDAIDGYPTNRRILFIISYQRRNNYSQGRRRLNGRAFKAQREDSIKRTVYVSDIDHNVTEERLAALFSAYGQVLDCRVCGDPHSRLRFAFVEFADENSARAALNLCGIMLGFSQVKVLPSKTAILPVNPTFLPRSEDEKEMCARTVYCTNIAKKVSQAEVKVFFESRCGEVSRIRLLGDHVHSTRIAFVEFVMAESAIIALDCCGQTLGSQPIRVSPSKTPVRPRVVRTLPTN